MQPTSARQCVRGHPLIGDGLFCLSCGAFQLDQQGTIEMASRGQRLLAWFVNTLLVLLTLVIGWIIWWFIVAPRGQNPGKAVVGLRVIGTDGRAFGTAMIFVRGLVGWAAGIVPFGNIIDSAWLLWDKDAQTLHDKSSQFRCRQGQRLREDRRAGRTRRAAGRIDAAACLRTARNLSVFPAGTIGAGPPAERNLLQQLRAAGQKRRAVLPELRHRHRPVDFCSLPLAHLAALC